MLNRWFHKVTQMVGQSPPSQNWRQWWSVVVLAIHSSLNYILTRQRASMVSLQYRGIFSRWPRIVFIFLDNWAYNQCSPQSSNEIIWAHSWCHPVHPWYKNKYLLLALNHNLEQELQWRKLTLLGWQNSWRFTNVTTSALLVGIQSFFVFLKMSNVLKPCALHLLSHVPANTSDSAVCPVSQKTNICQWCQQQQIGQLAKSSGRVSP